MIDTHSHLDGEEFLNDLNDAIARAQKSGVEQIFIPGINLASCKAIRQLCHSYPGYLYGMYGLHPEEVKEDWKEQLLAIRKEIECDLKNKETLIAIGEVGLDYYWSREFENEQLEAFRMQVEWSLETGLPLMIHCRKAQNEMIKLLKPYAKELPGGVFHCFTGNEKEAEELLQFDRFCLGIGGVFTFKSSNLPNTLPINVPLERIVLETDSPYMAPVPMRGKRNESAYVRHVLEKLALAYNKSVSDVEHVTTANAKRIFL